MFLKEHENGKSKVHKKNQVGQDEKCMSLNYREM